MDLRTRSVRSSLGLSSLRAICSSVARCPLGLHTKPAVKLFAWKRCASCQAVQRDCSCWLSGIALPAPQSPFHMQRPGKPFSSNIWLSSLFPTPACPTGHKEQLLSHQCDVSCWQQEQVEEKLKCSLGFSPPWLPWFLKTLNFPEFRFPNVW